MSGTYWPASMTPTVTFGSSVSLDTTRHDSVSVAVAVSVRAGRGCACAGHVPRGDDEAGGAAAYDDVVVFACHELFGGGEHGGCENLWLCGDVWVWVWAGDWGVGLGRDGEQGAGLCRSGEVSAGRRERRNGIEARLPDVDVDVDVDVDMSRTSYVRLRGIFRTDSY